MAKIASGREANSIWQNAANDRGSEDPKRRWNCASGGHASHALPIHPNPTFAWDGVKASLNNCNQSSPVVLKHMQTSIIFQPSSKILKQLITFTNICIFWITHWFFTGLGSFRSITFLVISANLENSLQVILEIERVVPVFCHIHHISSFCPSCPSLPDFFRRFFRSCKAIITP